MINNLKDFETILSSNFKHNDYVIVSHFISGFEDILNNSSSDIDIIFKNRAVQNRFIRILNCKKIYHYFFSYAYTFVYNGKEKFVDLFVCGDGYFPKKWERKMIKNAVSRNNIYFLNNEDYNYSYLYHAFFHKKNIDQEVLKKMRTIFNNNESPNYFLTMLLVFMEAKKLHFSITLDKKRINNRNIDGIKKMVRYPIPIFIKHCIYSICITLPHKLFGAKIN